MVNGSRNVYHGLGLVIITRSGLRLCCPGHRIICSLTSLRYVTVGRKGSVCLRPISNVSVASVSEFGGGRYSDDFNRVSEIKSSGLRIVSCTSNQLILRRRGSIINVLSHKGAGLVSTTVSKSKDQTMAVDCRTFSNHEHMRL